jgi:tetratricopeptide (TPR) repeat protein
MAQTNCTEAAVKHGVCTEVYKGNSTSPPTSGSTQPSAEETRRQAELKRQRDIEWSSEEAADYAKRGDWNNAIRSFEEALDRDPDNEGLAKDLARARGEKARAAALAAAPAVNMDSSVVDTRGVPKDAAWLIARVPQLAHSPAAEPIRKGFQALLTRDWKVALAWWQTALQSDPHNDALIRSIDLAQWMVDRPARVRGGAAPKPMLPAIDAATKGDMPRATRLLKQLAATDPAEIQRKELLLMTLRDRAPKMTTATNPDRQLEDFFLDPMFGSGLARLANGETQAAERIFDRIDANQKARR